MYHNHAQQAAVQPDPAFAQWQPPQQPQTWTGYQQPHMHEAPSYPAEQTAAAPTGPQAYPPHYAPQQAQHPQQQVWPQGTPSAWQPAPPQQPVWGYPPQQPPQAHAYPSQVWPPVQGQQYQPQPDPQGYQRQERQAPAPQQASVSTDVIRSLSESIDEIRATVRECRDAMRALADKHARRFF